MLQHLPRLYRIAYWIVIPVVIAFASATIGNQLVDNIDWLNEREINTQLEIGRDFGERVGIQWDKNLQIVYINKKSLDLLPLNGPVLARRNYARLIDRLGKSGAKGLYIDLTFLHPSSDDPLLRASINRKSPMYIALASFWTEEIADVRGRIEQASQLADLSYLIGKESRERVVPVSNVKLVNDALGGEFGQAAFQSADGSEFVGSAYAVALMLHGKSPLDLTANFVSEEVNAGALGWTFDGNFGQRLFFRATPPKSATIPIHEALELSDEALAATFANKVVLLGGGADMDNALADSPIGLIDPTMWTAQLANLLSQPAQNRLHYFTDRQLFVWLVILAFVAMHFGRLSGSFVGWFGILSLILVAAFMPRADLLIGNRLLETVAPVLSTLIGFVIAALAFAVLPSPTKAPGTSYQGAVVFLDLKNSTKILEMLGSQLYRKFIGEWYRVLDQIASRYGGELERTTGDGAFIVFPYRAQSATGENAIGAVMEALERTRKLANRHRKYWGLHDETAIGVRAGIEVGPLMGSYVREGGRMSWNSVGPCVNFARRLADEPIEPEQDVRLGPTIAQFIGDRYQVRKIKTFVPKGFSEESAIFIIERPREAACSEGGSLNGKS